MSKIIKVLLFLESLIIINSLINEKMSCYSDIISNYYKSKVNTEENIVGEAGNLLKEQFLKYVDSLMNEEGEVDDYFYDLIESLDQECWNLILRFFFSEKEFIYDISKKLIHDGGFIQYSIGAERDCLEENGVYLLFTGESNRSELMAEKTHKSQEALFKESNHFREEACSFSQCKRIHKPLFEYLVKYQRDKINGLFRWNNFELTEIDYKGITEEEKVQYTKEEQEKYDKEKKYYDIIIIIVIILLIFFLICSLISFIIEQCDIKFKNNAENSEETITRREILIPDMNNDNYSNIINENDIRSVRTDHSLKEKKLIDSKIYKIISSFDITNNLSILNVVKKTNVEEPLFNQENIIELSTIKLLILFFILLGENCFIILKYVDNKMSIVPFLKSKLFFTIKLGMNSYETYKVICGVLFGFKFISFYYKHDIEGEKGKKLFIFFTKIIPYVLMFLIIHFILNYPIFIYLRNFYGGLRNSYMSTLMEKCTCQNGPFEIFNFPSIMSEYGTTEFNIGLYTGCFWPILFTLSEFCCFIIVYILAVLNIYFRKYKNINKIIYPGILTFMFVFISLFFTVAKETKDIFGEYDEFTISRLFGLSGTIAMPHMFLPLYYIGFNIGIIYYYKKISSDDKIRNVEYKPFKYCYTISGWFSRLSGMVKNIFMSIFSILMLSCSLPFSFFINSIEEDEIIFRFRDIPAAKFFFIYEGSFQGIFFCFFLLFYLCSDLNIFKTILASEFFVFTNKISFTLFISFYSVLYFFHATGLMEIYLFPFSIISNAIILFIITYLMSIIFSCLFLFPSKWMHKFCTEKY